MRLPQGLRQPGSEYRSTFLGAEERLLGNEVNPGPRTVLPFILRETAPIEESTMVEV